MKWIIGVAVVLGAFLFVSGGDDDLDLDLPPVENSGGFQIPGLENLPINRSALPDPEEAERVLRAKCTKNGGEDAFDNALRAKTTAETCFRSLVNYTELIAEMEEAKPTGDLDSVFRKYCRKSPVLRGCILDLVTAMEQCMEEKERGAKALAQNVTDQLLGFVCFKEGDRIALFIAESGPECLTDKKEAVIHCINTTFGKHLPSGNIDITSLPSFIVGAEECKDVCALQNCVVRELEKCKEPTPANIVESMFRHVLKATPCSTCSRTSPAEVRSSNSANTAFSSVILTVAASLVLLH